MSKYTYRLIKNSWGISIILEGKIEQTESIPSIGKKILPNAWLDLQFDGLNLEEREKWIPKGIELAFQQFPEDFIKSNYFLFIITNLEFDFTDFQSEGLTCVVWGWINQEFGLPQPKIEVNFDKAKNKYLFDFA